MPHDKYHQTPSPNHSHPTSARTQGTKNNPSPSRAWWGTDNSTLLKNRHLPPENHTMPPIHLFAHISILPPSLGKSAIANMRSSTGARCLYHYLKNSKKPSSLTILKESIW